MKKIINFLRAFILWTLPFGFFIMLTYAPKFLWNIDFEKYLELLKILVWPATTILLLFFFKRVVTYLFFSMEKFNFFGLSGNLKNVNELILEETEKRYQEEKREKEMNEKVENILLDLNKKQEELKDAKDSAVKNRNVAKEILSDFKTYIEDNKKNYEIVANENKKLKNLISIMQQGLKQEVIQDSVSSSCEDGNQNTSDKILDQNN